MKSSPVERDVAAQSADVESWRGRVTLVVAKAPQLHGMLLPAGNRLLLADASFV